MLRIAVQVFGFLGPIIGGAIAANVNAAPAVAKPVATVINRYCLDCHDHESKKGELDLESLSRDEVTQHSDRWEKVVRRLNARQMPPAKRKSRPTEDEYESAATGRLRKADESGFRSPNRR